MTDVDFMEDTALPVSEQAMSKVSRIAETLVRQREEVSELEEKLKEAKEKERRLEMEDLPDAMDEAGISEITLVTGEKVKVEPFVRANISAANREAAFKWLRDNGFGDLIKRDISLSFGRGEDERAAHLIEVLQDMGFDPNDKEQVNWQTLTAFCKEQLQSGVSLPVDILGVYQGRKAKISKSK